MKHALCLILLCFTLQGFSLEEGGQPSDFSVEMEISSNAIGIDRQLTLQMTLKYPSTYHPNMDSIRTGLVQNTGLYEPPFTLVRDNVHPPQEAKGIKTQQIEFILSPQTTGKHYLTANLIQFDPNSKEGKKVFVASDVFDINVTTPPIVVDLHSLIEPPLPISQELPITLSQRNRRAFIDNPLLHVEEAEKNVDFIKSKAIPWLVLLASLATILVIAFARLLPPKALKYEIDPFIKDKNEVQIRKEFERLSSSAPKNSQEAGTFITRLDFLLRRYLLNKYDFPAFSFTAQELDQEIGTHDEISQGIRDGMSETFKAADQVKFAKIAPSQDEVIKLMENAKRLLSLAW